MDQLNSLKSSSFNHFFTEESDKVSLDDDIVVDGYFDEPTSNLEGQFSLFDATSEQEDRVPLPDEVETRDPAIRRILSGTEVPNE